MRHSERKNEASSGTLQWFAALYCSAGDIGMKPVRRTRTSAQLHVCAGPEYIREEMLC